MNESRSYLENVSLKFASGAIVFVLSTASGIIVARTLGAEGNGTVALLILIPTMIASFSSLGIGRAHGYLVGAGKHTPQTLVRNSISLSMMFSLPTGIAYWMAMPLFVKFLSNSNVSRSMLTLTFLIVPLSLLEMFLNGILLGLGQIAQLSIVSIIRFSSLLALNAVLVLALRFGVWGALCAAVCGSGICVATYFFFLKRDAKILLGLDTRALKDSLVYGVQAHLGTIIQFFNRRLDVFILNLFAGATDVGLYAVATSLAELLAYFPNAFGFALFPRTASSDLETAKHFTPKVIRLVALITVVAAIGLFLVSKPVITFFYTDEFSLSLYPLWALLPGMVGLSYSRIIFNDLGGRGKPHYGTIASLAAVFVTLGGDILLIPSFGIVGAAIASSLAYITNAAVAIYAYLGVSGNKLADILVVQKSDIKSGLDKGCEMVVSIKHRFAFGERLGTDLPSPVGAVLTGEQLGKDHNK